MLGKTISHYQITGKLGEGGMGVVYKADDTKLERTVALKFLADHLLRDEEARKRFQREAKAAAALHHPNICPVHEIAEAEGETFIAMAFIEGQNLDDRIAAGPLPLAQALDIAHQIATGLEAAHAKGIVHRDIKPGNIIVDDKGHVTVMDFGLALLTEGSKLTKLDTTVGTVAYMSPEQAQGVEVDRRTDIWALGCVLFEMVCGHRPFRGEYEQALLYEIVHQEPEALTGLRSGVPIELERIAGKCLAKDAATRYQHADELLADLTALRRALDSGPSKTRAVTPAASQRLGPTISAGPKGAAVPVAEPTAKARTSAPLLAAVALVCLIAGFVAAWMTMGSGSRAEAPVRKFSLAFDDLGPAAQISPDGKRIAYITGTWPATKLWIRDLDSWESRALDGTEGAVRLSWSPDGNWLAFVTRGAIKKVQLQGGSVTPVCERRSPQAAWVSWAPDGNKVLFTSGFPSRIYQVSAAGGSPELFIEPNESEAATRFTDPSLLPPESGRRALLYRLGQDIVVEDLDASERRPLTQGDNPVYVSSGHILYQQGGRSGAAGTGTSGTLWALPFSLKELKATGEPFLIGPGEYPSVSNEGTLLSSLGRQPSYSLVWRDRGGNRTEVIGGLRGSLLYPSLSRSGRYVAVPVVGAAGTHIWIHDTKNATDLRLTFGESGINIRPVWGPSDQVAYSSLTDKAFDIFAKSVDGSAPARVLLAEAGAEFADDWSVDGRYIIAARVARGGMDTWYLRLAEDGTVEETAPYLETPYAKTAPSFSPDGRFVGYASIESGKFEVYVQSFPDPSGKWLVSTNGGSQLRWSRDGKELFYVEGETLISVSISLQPSFSMGRRRKLFSTPELALTSGPQRYDVSPDGKRFVTLEVVEPASNEIRIVENWYEEFRGRED